MVLVNSFDEVRSYINKVRSLRKGFLTNFFPDQKKIDGWTSRNFLYAIESEESVLFLKEDDGFFYVLYCATSKESLYSALSQLPQDKYVFDQIVDARTDASLIDGFLDLGFSIRKSLVRMSRVNTDAVSSEPNEDFDATFEDRDVLYSLLQEHFDKYAEQLPTKEEIAEFIETKHALVKRIEGQIAGFILYDLSPSTLYLRYWLVNPVFRNQGVGSSLFKEYNKRGAICKRHMLWVVEDNNNAIVRYEHYNYKNEPMKDFVLTKNITPALRGG